MGKLEPSWAWLGKEFLNYEPLSHEDPDIFKNNVMKALLDMAFRLLKETDQTEPPFDPEPIAKIRKIKIIKLPLEYDGMLIPTDEGFLMKINNDLPIVRQRFICAHEICHTFLFDMRTNPPKRAFISQMSRYWAEENTINRIARELLMPESIIKNYLEKAQPPYIEDFKKIMKLFFVSGEVLSWRLRDLQIWKALILIFEFTNEFEIKLHSSFNCSKKELKVGKKGTPVKDPIFYRILHRAFLDGIKIQENVEISVGNFKKYCSLIGAMQIGNNPTKIIAIIPL